VFVVDTNILIHAANFDSPYNDACRRSLDAWRRQSGAWYLTWGVCYEFMRIVTHRRALRSPWRSAEAYEFLRSIMSSQSLGMLVPTERHSQVLAELISEMPRLSGNVMHDAATAVLMREHGIKTIYTRDTDFHRFRFLEPVDPTV
jgi:toxin-antitoxin system PIN domain toxin